MIDRALIVTCLVVSVVCSCSDNPANDVNSRQDQPSPELPKIDQDAKVEPDSDLDGMGTLMGISRGLTAHHKGARGTYTLSFRDSTLSDGAGWAMQISKSHFDGVMEFIELQGKPVPVLSPRQLPDGFGSLPRVIYSFTASRPNSLLVICEGEYKSQ